MAASRKAKKGDVLSHWYTVVDFFNIPCKDFYAGIERELDRRKVPGLKISQVIFSESGFFSAKRIYLRMKRETLVFDICAAPFGTSYFFSMRFAEVPKGISWWRWIPLVLGLFWGAHVWMQPRYVYAGTPLIYSIIGIVVVMFVLWLTIKVIEDHFCRESYYRQDTRLMYLEIVNAVVKQTIAEFTSAGGINLLNIHQHSPLMDDLYRTTQVAIQPAEQPVTTPPEQVSQ